MTKNNRNYVIITIYWKIFGDKACVNLELYCTYTPKTISKQWRISIIVEVYLPNHTKYFQTLTMPAKPKHYAFRNETIFYLPDKLDMASYLF